MPVTFEASQKRLSASALIGWLGAGLERLERASAPSGERSNSEATAGTRGGLLAEHDLEGQLQASVAGSTVVGVLIADRRYLSCIDNPAIDDSSINN